MKVLAAAGLALGLALASGCREKDDVTITETRQASGGDDSVRIFATSDERFGNARPAPFTATTPDGWNALPGNEFRLLNYHFGPNGSGEAWVSVANGSLADNVNRWLKQVGAPALDDAGIQALRRVPLLGVSGVWVEARGDYTGTMGSPPKPNHALAGVVAEVQGQIITVKMIAPAADLPAAIPALEALISSLRMAE